jgi:Ca-activated chloride channel family protein
MLTDIATSTGGRYFRARDAESLKQIYATLDELEPISRESRQMRPLQALYFYPLGLALLITMLMGIFPLIKQFLSDARQSGGRQSGGRQGAQQND